MKNQIKILQALNILTFIGIIIINFLANYLPINGLTTGEVSAEYENLFTPANYTFTIWPIIYLGLLAFVLYQSQGLFSRNSKQNLIVAEVGYAFFINGIANITWIIAWHYMQFNLTIILMAIILLSLIDINLRLHRSSSCSDAGSACFWLAKVPFGLYLGWICVATIANSAVYLTFLGWTGDALYERVWTIIALLLGGFIGLWILARLRSVAAGLAITWGLIGVLVHYWQVNASYYLRFTAIVVIVLLCTGIARSLRRSQQTNVVAHNRKINDE